MPNFARIVYYLFTGLRRLYWSKSDLQRFQEKRLRSLIHYAYENVPFYHQKFREAQISPFDIKTPDDLSKLPVVRKDEVRRESIERLVSREFSIGDLKTLRTSGSMGKPFLFYVSKKEDDWRKAIYLRANISCGQRPRDRWAFVTSPRHIGDTTDMQLRLNIFAQRCISIFSSIDEQLRFLKQINSDVIDGYSGALFLLAREVEKQGLSGIHPRLIFGSADLIDVSQSKYIEEVFGAPYYDQFGCAEVDRTAWQCPDKAGYHMDVDSVITQFVDSDGNDVSAGESGEVVYTSLFNYAMPFIRYSVGDVGKPSDEICSCGRILPLMGVVEGRKDSLIALPNGRVLSPRAFTVAMSMFKHYENIEQFRIVQKKGDLLEILVKIKDSYADREHMETDLVTHLKSLLPLGESEIRFDVKFVDNIALSKSGRLMAVASELAHNA